jgi:hypothetical protein
MPELRLSKLPARTPVKISISITPVLHAALTVIPYMLAAFIESDSGFRKARRELGTAPDGGGRNAPESRQGDVAAASAASTASPNDSN